MVTTAATPPPKIHRFSQGTAEWHMARMGRITSSRFSEVMTPKTRKPSTQSRGYLNELLAEYAILRNLEASQLICDPLEQFQWGNRATRWGNEQEEHAREAYEVRTERTVDPIGFMEHGGGQLIGASTDGLIGDDGLLEIKCPWTTKKHIETIREGMPPEHAAQIQGALWISGREWCDFVSFDPRLASVLSLYVERVRRDEDYIEALATCVGAFHEQYLEEFRSICQKG